VVPAGQQPTGHPGQQSQPGAADIDSQPAISSRDGRARGYASLLKPDRYREASGELSAIARCHGLGHQAAIIKIDEPGPGTHAPSCAVTRTFLMPQYRTGHNSNAWSVSTR
jgi:hypothetical protein